MKRLFIFLFFHFSALCIALPNINLYEQGNIFFKIEDDNIFDEDENLLYSIRDNKFYDEDDYDEDDEYETDEDDYDEAENDCIGTIEETESSIVVTYLDSEKIDEQKEYSKSSGNIILKKTYINGVIIDSIEYDDIMGHETKQTVYTKGKIYISIISEYENDNLKKKTYFDENDSVTGYTLFSYDKNNILKESYYYNENNLLLLLTEFDIKTGIQIKDQKFNDDGTVKHETIYDKNTGNVIEQLSYEQTSENPTNSSSIKFNDK